MTKKKKKQRFKEIPVKPVSFKRPVLSLACWIKSQQTTLSLLSSRQDTFFSPVQPQVSELDSGLSPRLTLSRDIWTGVLHYLHYHLCFPTEQSTRQKHEGFLS